MTARRWIALGLNLFLAEKGVRDLRELRGAGLSSVSMTTNVLERHTVIFPEFDLTRCIGCGRCQVSCADGGRQAIRLDENRRPRLNGARCVGCHLCRLVCPQRAISGGRKRISRPAAR